MTTYYCPYCPDEPPMYSVEPGRLRCPECGRERDVEELVPGRLADIYDDTLPSDST
jgi:uncharacterized Zn finger protein (UPF0148 family)